MCHNVPCGSSCTTTTRAMSPFASTSAPMIRMVAKGKHRGTLLASKLFVSLATMLCVPSWACVKITRCAVNQQSRSCRLSPVVSRSTIATSGEQSAPSHHVGAAVGATTT